MDQYLILRQSKAHNKLIQRLAQEKQTYIGDEGLEGLEGLITVLGNGDLEALGLEGSASRLEALGRGSLGVGAILEVGDLLIGLEEGLEGGVGVGVGRAGRHLCVVVVVGWGCVRVSCGWLVGIGLDCWLFS